MVKLIDDSSLVELRGKIWAEAVKIENEAKLVLEIKLKPTLTDQLSQILNKKGDKR